MNARTALRVIVMMAFRNLRSHRVKSAIVGSIMVFGTALMIVGLSLLDSVEGSMQKVVTSSLAGHLQVYSSEGRDKLALFGELSTSQPDIGEIEDFAALKAEVSKIDNVQAVIPMGLGIAIGSGGNDVDRVLESLRAALDEGKPERAASHAAQLKRIAQVLLDEQQYRVKISSDTQKLTLEKQVLQRVLSDAFWKEFDEDPAGALVFLETKLAPLVPDSRPFFIRYMGTNPEAFRENFDRFEIAKGQRIPAGKRGLLISNRANERFLKHKVAREFDRLKRARDDEGDNLDEDEPSLGRAKRLKGQYRRVLLQLDDEEGRALEAKFKELMPEAKGDLTELLKAFLDVNEANFERRYAFFYETIAPMIDLYRVNVGDVVVLRSFSQRGGLESVNVKVWGIFQFKGIEDSDLAGAVNIMDMLTFRELYGKMTAAQLAELEVVRADAGSDDVAQGDVVDALFGEDDTLVQEPSQADEGFDEFKGVDIQGRQARAKALSERSYTTEEIDQGVALNSAIVLRDADRLKQTKRAVEALIEQKGWKLRVVDWQEAAGIVGQLIIVIRVILYIAIFIIFSVALIIINNSMVMATMERVGEVGTMRAIGAKRGFVLSLFLLETLVLGTLAGLLGAALGAGVVVGLGAWGIPATSDILRFLFAGPRLHPDVGIVHVITGLVMIFLVSIASTLYPAIIATRIQPVVAMRGRD